MICALNVHQYLDSFREGRPKDRQFTLRMLKTALDENPESLKRILSDVLELPKEKQTELAICFSARRYRPSSRPAKWWQTGCSF